MAKKYTRKQISKKIRFEIFKRDKFKCVYCGKSAPNVILHIDHIEPVSKGGSNDILNLVTSCSSCNLGKSNTKLDDNSLLEKQRTQLEELQERKEQIEMMMNWQKELTGFKDSLIDNLKEYWERLAFGYNITENGLKKFKKGLRDFGYEEMREAMEISAEQYLIFDNETKIVTLDSWETAFKKIYAIAKVKEDTKKNPALKDLFYIRGIVRNKVRGYYDHSLTIELLKQAYKDGASIEKLKEIALTNDYMDDFEVEIRNFINNND